jgi:hypothetical protein
VSQKDDLQLKYHFQPNPSDATIPKGMRLKIYCIYKVRFLRRFGIQAIALSPFVLFAMDPNEVSESLFRHELEHIYQAKRLGWLGLYGSYLKAYFLLRRKGLTHFAAYWNIPFEVEAREAEKLPLSEEEAALFYRHQSKTMV